MSSAPSPERSGPHFRTRVTRSGDGGLPVEAGRYRLVVSYACPWAHRSIIVRSLLGLQDAISLAVADPIQDEKSWRFTLDPGGVDPVLGVRYLGDIYERTEPGAPGGVSVPALVDTRTGLLATNDYDQLTLDFSTEWVDHHRPGAPNLYPEPLREDIDELNAILLADVNDGVYRAGFATSQEGHNEAVERLFDRLAWLEDRLSRQRYLHGDEFTESDVRLFTTLVRFDAVYQGHFKCNLSTLAAMPVLSAYARGIYQMPGIRETVNFDHIKRHYYLCHPHIDPSGIVPVGPSTKHWDEPTR